MEKLWGGINSSATWSLVETFFVSSMRWQEALVIVWDPVV